jgi:hypothetical protein
MDKIAIISMVRNDDMFIQKWISYYGKHFGENNLFLILDGMDQIKPKNHNINCLQVPHKKLSRSQGDKNRVQIVSSLAKSLFKRYQRIIACDIDEFLVLDPNVKSTLSDYLLEKTNHTSLSALGIDVAQNIDEEEAIDLNKPFLSQRSFGVIASRYTKPVVACKPLDWGSGYHRVKWRNYNIDQNLFLFHFGMIDYKRSTGKTEDSSRINEGWTNHLERRFKIFEDIRLNKVVSGDAAIKSTRTKLQWIRTPYAWNKPRQSKPEVVIEIPNRFKSIV